MLRHHLLKVAAALALLTLLGADVDTGNLLADPADPASWTLQLHADAAATLTATDDGQLVLDVTEPGSERWHVQLYRAGVPLVEGARYVLNADVRADPRRPALVLCVRDADGKWQDAGFRVDVGLAGGYEEHEFTFTATNLGGGAARVPLLALGKERGRYHLKNVTLTALD